MTAKEAIAYISTHDVLRNDNKDDRAAIGAALHALRRQEEKPPVPFIRAHTQGCPHCGRHVWSHTEYCSHCGQAIKWEED